MEINKECGKRLRECFEASDFKTQQELADATGFSSVYISNIMTGKKPMTITAAKILSEKLGVLENYLLCKINSKTKDEQSKIFRDAIEDMEDCIERFASYNGLTIKRLLFITDTGESIDSKRKYLALPRHQKQDFLGKQKINGQQYNIIAAKYEIEIYEKTYIVDADRILEIFDFVIHYIQTARSRLHHELEKKDNYLNIKNN